ncbi:MAG: hypothetical protein BGO98_07815 [Myxococcales bacterium 68-20]|nr:MAG: hypothetical protein BGO98_07815 [Myxococcales bacterium 68-20]
MPIAIRLAVATSVLRPDAIRASRTRAARAIRARIVVGESRDVDHPRLARAVHPMRLEVIL